LQQEGISTVSGWVTHKLGGFPKVGDVLSVGAYDLRVEAMDGMRVGRLKLTKRAEQDPPADSPSLSLRPDQKIVPNDSGQN